MTVDQAIEEYLRMARTVFKSPSLPGRDLHQGSGTVFDGKALADCLHGTVAQYLHDPDARLFETSDPQFHIALLAATRAYADSSPYVF